jgi:hypothetical protein
MAVPLPLMIAEKQGAREQASNEWKVALPHPSGERRGMDGARATAGKPSEFELDAELNLARGG